MIEMLQRVLCLKKSAGRSVAANASVNASTLFNEIHGSDFSYADVLENHAIVLKSWGELFQEAHIIF